MKRGDRAARAARATKPAAALILLIAALGPAPRAGTAGTAALSGRAQQLASASSPLSGSFPWADTVAGGASSSLALVLEAKNESASFRAKAHCSLLWGAEVQTLWSSLTAYPEDADSLLLSSPFDAAAKAPEAIALASLDELALEWDIGRFALEAGKTYANWGVGKAFSPADFFAEFDYTSGSPVRRPKLLARATWFAGDQTRLDAVYDPYAAAGATAAARAYSVISGTLAGAAALSYRESVRSSGPTVPTLLGALEATFDLPFVSPYFEAAAAAALDGSGKTEPSLLAGAMARAGDAIFMGEYLYSPAASAAHSVFAQASLAFDEWTSLAIPLLWYPGSGVLGAGATLTIAGAAGMDFALTAAANRSAAGSWQGKIALGAGLSF